MWHQHSVREREARGRKRAERQRENADIKGI